MERRRLAPLDAQKSVPTQSTHTSATHEANQYCCRKQQKGKNTTNKKAVFWSKISPKMSRKVISCMSISKSAYTVTHMENLVQLKFHSYYLLKTARKDCSLVNNFSQTSIFKSLYLSLKPNNVWKYHFDLQKVWIYLSLIMYDLYFFF